MPPLRSFFLTLALLLGTVSGSAADDVVVSPGPGDVFKINGTTVVDPLGEVPPISDPPGIWVSKGSSKAGALVIEKGSGTQGNLVCLGGIDSSDGFALDSCGTTFDNSGSLRTPNSILIDGLWLSAPLTLFALDLIYPLVTRTTAQFFTCRDLETPHDGDPHNDDGVPSGWWLEADYRPVDRSPKATSNKLHFFNPK